MPVCVDSLARMLIGNLIEIDHRGDAHPDEYPRFPEPCPKSRNLHSVIPAEAGIQRTLFVLAQRLCERLDFLNSEHTDEVLELPVGLPRQQVLDLRSEVVVG